MAKHRHKGKRVRHGGGLGYLGQPLTSQQINQQANRLANFQYGGQEQALQQRQTSVAPWFQNYVATIQGAQRQNQQLVQPMVANAQTAAQNTGQQTLADHGLNPGSEAVQNDALAAAARKALQTTAATHLASILANGQTFLSNQQAIAPMYAQQVTTDLGRQQSQLAREKGQYRSAQVGDLQNQERQYGLGLQHQAAENAAFGVSAANTAADNARADQALRSSNRNQRLNRQARGQSVNAYGYTAKEWQSFSPARRQQIMAKIKAQGHGGSGRGGKGGLTPYQRQQNRKARNTAIQRVSDIVSVYGEYRNGTVPASKNPDGSINPEHKPSDAEVRQRLRNEKYTTGEINLAIKLRHKSLTQADVRAAKRLGIWPIPKQWLKYVIPDQPPRSGTPAAKKKGAAGYPYGEGAGVVY